MAANENERSAFEREIRSIIQESIRDKRDGRRDVKSIYHVDDNGMETRTNFFKNGNEYFVEVNDKVVARSLNRDKCLVDAFVHGYLSDEDYVNFRSGSKARELYMLRRTIDKKTKRKEILAELRRCGK